MPLHLAMAQVNNSRASMRARSRALARSRARARRPLGKRTLFLLLYKSAARAEEVLAIDVDDLDLRRRMRQTGSPVSQSWSHHQAQAEPSASRRALKVAGPPTKQRCFMPQNLLPVLDRRVRSVIAATPARGPGSGRILPAQGRHSRRNSAMLRSTGSALSRRVPFG